MHKSGMVGKRVISWELREQQLQPRYAAGFARALVVARRGTG